MVFVLASKKTGASIHELGIQYCIIVYSTGLRDKQKTAWHPRASCFINCVLPTGKSVINPSLKIGISRAYLRFCKLDTYI